MNDHSTLDKAIIVATHAHKGQVDKSGQPYILHPLRVMLKVPSSLRTVAVLHDVIEDTPLTKNDLSFVGSDDLNTIMALTQGEDERYYDYIERLSEDPRAVIVKLADLEDNMLLERMKGIDKPWSLMKRYSKAHYILSEKK